MDYKEFYKVIMDSPKKDLLHGFEAEQIRFQAHKISEVISHDSNPNGLENTVRDMVNGFKTLDGDGPYDTWALHQTPTFEEEPNVQHYIDADRPDSRLLLLVRNGIFVPPGSLDFVTEEGFPSPLKAPSKGWEALVRIGLIHQYDPEKMNKIIGEYNNLDMQKVIYKLTEARNARLNPLASQP